MIKHVLDSVFSAFARARSSQSGLSSHWRQIGVVTVLFLLPLVSIPFVDAANPEEIWTPLASWPGASVVSLIRAGRSDDTSILYAAGPASSLMVSADQGATWERSVIPTEPGLLGVLRIVDLAINPARPTEAYAAVEPSEGALRPMLYSTRDGGLNWGVQSALGPMRVAAIAYEPRGGDLYVIAGGDVLKLDAETASDDSPMAGNGGVQPISSIDATAPITSFQVGVGSAGGAQGAAHLLYVGSRRGLAAIADTDEGARLLPWAEDPDTEYIREQAYIHAICIVPDLADVVCVGTDQGVFASSDAGRTWYRTAYELRDRRVLSLLWDPRAEAIFAGVAGAGLYCSHDNGTTWRAENAGLARRSGMGLAIVQPAGAGDTLDEGMLLAATNDGIWQRPVSSLRGRVSDGAAKPGNG